jgi:hypothetical protein
VERAESADCHQTSKTTLAEQMPEESTIHSGVTTAKDKTNSGPEHDDCDDRSDATPDANKVADSEATVKDNPIQQDDTCPPDNAASDDAKPGDAGRNAEEKAPVPEDTMALNVNGTTAQQTTTAKLRGGGRQVRPFWDLGLLD